MFLCVSTHQPVATFIAGSTVYFIVTKFMLVLKTFIDTHYTIQRSLSFFTMTQFDLHTNSNLKRQQSHDQSHDPSHDNHKKVLFNIAGSDEGLQFCSDSFLVPPSSSTGNGPTSCNASDITGVTGSTFVSDISINIEQTDVDEKVSNGGMGYSSDGKQEDTVEGKYNVQ